MIIFTWFVCTWTLFKIHLLSRSHVYFSCFNLRRRRIVRPWRFDAKPIRRDPTSTQGVLLKGPSVQDESPDYCHVYRQHVFALINARLRRTSWKNACRRDFRRSSPELSAWPVRIFVDIHGRTVSRKVNRGRMCGRRRVRGDGRRRWHSDGDRGQRTRLPPGRSVHRGWWRGGPSRPGLGWCPVDRAWPRTTVHPTFFVRTICTGSSAFAIEEKPERQKENDETPL